MKNNKLLYAFVIMMITTCQMKTFAQVECVTTSTMPNAISNTIVRNYKNGEVVSYVRTSTDSYFTLSDAQSYNNWANIDRCYEVKDMAIDKEYAYFCGVNNSTNRGFIGYFHIGNLFNGTDGYFVLDNLPSILGGWVEELNRMVVFYNGDGLNVACIGIDDNSPFQTCIVDYLPWTSAANNYTIGVVQSFYSSKYRFLDITITNNYVVVSDLLNRSCIPSLRVFDINNLWASGGIQDYFYAFGEFLDNMVFNYDDLLIEHIQSDIVVTATYWKRLYSPSQYEETNFRVYDINQMLSTPYSGMMYSFGMSQPCTTGNWKLFELKNDPTNRCLRLLQRTDEPTAPGGIAYVVNEIDYTTVPPTGPISGHYIPDYGFHSLDVFDPQYSISTGMDVRNPNEMKFWRRMPFQTFICSKTVGYPFSRYSNSRNKKEFSPLSILTTNMYPLKLKPVLKQNPAHVECGC